MLPVPDREACSFSSIGRAVDGLHAGEIASRHKDGACPAEIPQ